MVNPILGNPFANLGPDFYGFFLPWIFTFAIVYGLLFKIKLFGEINARISAALAFVIAFFVTAVGGPQLASFFTTIFGGASIFLAGILVVILFAAMLGYGEDTKKKFQHTGALVVVVIIGVLLFLASSGQFVAINVISPGMAGMVFWLVIIVVAIYFVMGKKEEGGGDKKG